MSRRPRAIAGTVTAGTVTGETLDGIDIPVGPLTVEAVLFDLDGTLIDSVPDLLDAVNRLLLSMQRRSLGLDEVTRMVGDGAAALVERALTATGAPPSPAAVPDLVQRFLKLYTGAAANRTRLYPDAVAVVQALSRAGIKLGLVTNKPMSATRAVLQEFGLDPWFGVVIGGDSLAEKKPSGLPVLHGLRMLGVASDRAAMVGDMPNDFKAARAAAVRPVIVTYGYAAGKPAAFGARETIDRLRDLPALLARPAPREGMWDRAMRVLGQQRQDRPAPVVADRKPPPLRDPDRMDRTV